MFIIHFDIDAQLNKANITCSDYEALVTSDQRFIILVYWYCLDFIVLLQLKWITKIDK